MPQTTSKQSINDHPPAHVSASLAGAWRLWESGELDQAELLCAELSQASPENGELCHLTGLIFLKKGQLDQAQANLERAIAIEPHQPLHFNNLGVVHNAMAMFNKAVTCLNQAIALAPDYYEAHNNLGLSLFHLNQLSQAAQRFEHALGLCPTHGPSLANLGMVRLSQGDFKEAIQAYEGAVAIDCSQAKWWANLGAAYLGADNFQKSVICFQQARRIDPNNVEHDNGMAVVLRAKGDFESSIEILQRAHKAAPDNGDILSNLCIALQQTCQWTQFDSYVQRLDLMTRQALASNQLPAEQPMFNIRRSSDQDLNLAVASAWSQESSRRALRNATPFKFVGRRSAADRITVGYLSYDFRDHPVCHQLLPLFGLHDRTQFKVVTFSMGPDDHSIYRDRIIHDSDAFIDIREMNPSHAAEEIYNHGVDILVDLMGHSHHSRLEILALRPAPLQVSYLGFLSSSGADFVDYTIADPVVVPEHDMLRYREQLIYMPHCYQMNHNAFANEGAPSLRSNWGLPDNGFVFCSFNKPYKIDASLFQCWASILRQVPESVLWLYDDNPVANEMLVKAAQYHGVAPHRLVFSPKVSLPDHLKRLELADLALDTVAYNGGATTANALWAGLPVLSVFGAHWVSRMTASHLLAAGLPELVAGDLADYERTAIKLAQMPKELEALQQRLKVNRTIRPLFDAHTFVRDLESAYEQIWQHYCAGLSPMRTVVTSTGR